MSSRKKSSNEVYVPPGRRSEDGSSNGGTPTKYNQQGPSRELPPNCCEDEEEGEVYDSPIKSPPSLSSENSSNSSNWRSHATTSSSISTEIQGKLKIGNRRSLNNEVIPVKQRSIVNSKNNFKQDHEKISNNTPLSLIRKYNGDLWRNSPENVASKMENILDVFHNSNVSYIDSHCHTDYMYTALHRQKYPEHHDGLENWMEKFPQAFPKSFSGLIANFIKPDLFVDMTSNYNFDMQWIEDELKSDLYLGTTWGCHPNFAQKWGKLPAFWHTLDHIFSNASEWKVLAVGECGIDLHRCESEIDMQRMVFDRHVALAYKYKLPLVIHCRNGNKGQAEEECLKILKKQMNDNHPFLKIHRHCYTENWDTAKMWLEQCKDVHFGFTAAVFTFNEYQIEAIRQIPLDRILLETDGPFFKPRYFDGIAPPKVTFPGMAIATAFRIAEIKGLSMEEVLRATYNNTRRLYQIPVF